MFSKLTGSQRKYIEENFRTKSDKEIAKELMLSNKAVRKAIKSLGLKRSKDDEVRIKKAHKQQTEEMLTEKSKNNIILHLTCIAIVVILVFVAYANSLQNDFIWDDEFLVRDNQYIRSFSHIKDIFTSYLASTSGNINNFYRPIQDLSYMVDYFLWGYDPMGFHLTNVILHGICAILLYILVLKIFANFKIAFVGSVLFGIHPINTEAVTYVAGRADSLYMAFFLLSFILFLKILDKLKTGEMGYFYLSLSVASYALAILSKEMAIILPFMLLLYQAVFIKSARVANKSAYIYVPYCGVGIVYIFLRKTILNFSNISPSFYMAKFSLYERLLTMSKTIIVYLRLLIFPFDLHMERTIGVARSLFEPDAFISCFIIALILLGIFYAYKKSKILFFASMWFMVALMPVSNIVPINSFIAEHWLYCPAIGIFMIAGILFTRLWDTKAYKAMSKISAFLISVFLIFFYTSQTMQRNRDWKDEVAFFKNTIKYSPDNARLHLNFGNTYFELNMQEEAISEYNKSIELNPNDPAAYSNLGSIYLERGMYNDAMKCIEKALSIKPNYPEALFNLGMTYQAMGNYGKAEDCYNKALGLRPDFLAGHIRLGEFYLDIGQSEKAKRHLQEVLRINPNEKKAKHLLESYFH